jgi:hypothetical protein
MMIRFNGGLWWAKNELVFGLGWMMLGNVCQSLTLDGVGHSGSDIDRLITHPGRCCPILLPFFNRWLSNSASFPLPHSIANWPDFSTIVACCWVQSFWRKREAVPDRPEKTSERLRATTGCTSFPSSPSLVALHFASSQHKHYLLRL